MQRRLDPNPPPWASSPSPTVLSPIPVASTASAADDSDSDGPPPPPPGTTFRDLGLHGGRSFAGIATRAFGLGAAFSLSLAAVAYLAGTGVALWRLPFFVGALALFHFLEFWTTAAYNTPHCEVDSFLLTANWPAYAIAHAAAAVECLRRRARIGLWPCAPSGW
jgi:protein-S-isoprenylcysteine O-methyltransferase